MTREEAIQWMQEEKASFERAPVLNGCPMTEDWQKAIDVYDMAISALRAQQEQNDWVCTLKCKALIDEGMCSHGGLCCLYECQRTIKENEPLTLEDLRQMDGEPVWVDPNDSCPPHWRIWSNSEPFDMTVFKAYRRKPEEGT